MLWCWQHRIPQKTVPCISPCEAIPSFWNLEVVGMVRVICSGNQEGLAQGRSQCVTWIPSTASFEALTRNKDQEDFNVSDGFEWISEERRHLTLKVSPLLRQKLFWEQDALHMHWKNSSASSLHNSHHPHAAIEYKHWDSVPRFSSCNSLHTLRDQIRVFTLSTPNKVSRLNPNILHLMLSGLLWENHTRR